MCVFGYIHKFCSREDFKQIVYNLETQEFVVTTNWLQLSLSAFTVHMETLWLQQNIYCVDTPKL